MHADEDDEPTKVVPGDAKHTIAGPYCDTDDKSTERVRDGRARHGALLVWAVLRAEADA